MEGHPSLGTLDRKALTSQYGQQPIGQGLAPNHRHARLFQGARLVSALRPTLSTCQSCRDTLDLATSWISVLERVGQTGFAFNIFWTFFSILRVFKSRHDSFKWSF